MHCVESVQIRSFFWSIFSCIRTEYQVGIRGKYRPEKIPYLDTFHTDVFSKGKSSSALILIFVYL